MSDYFICNKCSEPKETDFLCVIGSHLICFECFDEINKKVDISEVEE